MTKPLCFVLMPFGKKKDVTGREIDFDHIYDKFIKAAIEKANMEPVRADEEVTGGVIHKHMFERLLLCDFAVADLTLANANVFYELGIRHGTRPWSTVSLFETRTRLPFDVQPFRSLPYTYENDQVKNLGQATEKLTALLREALQNHPTDSPFYQLIDEMPHPDIAHIKTDIFRDRIHYNKKVKAKLQAARELGKKDKGKGVEAIKDVEEKLGDLAVQEVGILLDLFLSYRAVEQYEKMVELTEAMPDFLPRTVLVQEQKAFALNRLKKRDQAKRILLDLIKEHGPSSETYGLLGRVYKDLWEDAQKEGSEIVAAGYLDQAIDAYLKGFEADWRDAYPGVNTVTLMTIQGKSDDRLQEILPVVTYAAKRHLQKSHPDYWDYATLLELSVIAGEEEEARKNLALALANIREPWEPKTTARNLRLIREAKGEEGAWIKEVVEVLEQ
jgi:tetratricopeptide (TPR) repeat protein